MTTKTRRLVGRSVLALFVVGAFVLMAAASIHDGHPWWAGPGLLAGAGLVALLLATMMEWAE